jgi:urea-proton symporter
MVETTKLEYPTLAGNLVAIMTGLISLVKPQPFDWEVTCSINASVINESTLIASPPESTPNLSDSEKEKERIRTWTGKPKPPNYAR